MRNLHAGLFIAAAALVVTSCSGAPDRAGGESDEPVTVLTLGQTNRGGPFTPLVRWADEIERLSDGAIKIEFKNAWRDEATSDRTLLSDVKDGKYDLASVSTRIFDQVGYRDFEALSAPLLVDSYELQVEVFEAGIVDDMLSGVEDIGLDGVAVIPGILHRVAATDFAPTSLRALTAKTIATPDSGVGIATVRSLGATPAGLYSSADVDGYDALTLQPSAVSGNSWQDRFRHFAGNVVLWPRPLAIVMGPEVAASLDKEQREVLELAAEHLRSVAVQDARDDDAAGVKVLCGSGVRIVYASSSDLAALRAATQPVYDEIARDPQSSEWLTEIEELKLELAAETDVLACPSAPPPTVSAQDGIPDATYERSFTRTELEKNPHYEEWWPAGRHTLTFKDGVMTKTGPEGDIETLSYTLFQGRLKADNRSSNVDFIATYRVDGDEFLLTDFVWPNCTDCYPDEAAFSTSESKPWVLVQ